MFHIHHALSEVLQTKQHTEDKKKKKKDVHSEILAFMTDYNKKLIVILWVGGAASVGLQSMTFIFSLKLTLFSGMALNTRSGARAVLVIVCGELKQDLSMCWKSHWNLQFLCCVT